MKNFVFHQDGSSSLGAWRCGCVLNKEDFLL